MNLKKNGLSSEDLTLLAALLALVADILVIWALFKEKQEKESDLL
ncbi:hypothetical protein [Brevibacillus humidisoli]|nr:hypothetical protein [Brevibacillus humidisoli]